MKGQVIGDWVLGDSLGTGAFASVFRAHHRRSRQVAAVKSIARSADPGVLACVETEIQVLRWLGNCGVGGVVRLLGEIWGSGEEEPLAAAGSFHEDVADLASPFLSAIPPVTPLAMHSFNVNLPNLRIRGVAFAFASLCADVLETTDHTHLVLQLVPGQELFSYLTAQPGGVMHPRQVQQIVYQLLQTLASMHAMGVLHLDCKLDNILLDKHSGRVTLIDFNLAAFFEPGERSRTFFDNPVGSIHYASPSILRCAADGVPYEAANGHPDLWALGVCTYGMLCGVWPFHEDSDPAELHREIWESLGKGLRFYNLNTEGCEAEEVAMVKHFVRCMLDPRQTWTAEQLLGHPWMRNVEKPAVNKVQVHVRTQPLPLPLPTIPVQPQPTAAVVPPRPDFSDFSDTESEADTESTAMDEDMGSLDHEEAEQEFHVLVRDADLDESSSADCHRQQPSNLLHPDLALFTSSPTRSSFMATLTPHSPAETMRNSFSFSASRSELELSELGTISPSTPRIVFPDDSDEEQTMMKLEQDIVRGAQNLQALCLGASEQIVRNRSPRPSPALDTRTTSFLPTMSPTDLLSPTFIDMDAHHRVTHAKPDWPRPAISCPSSISAVPWCLEPYPVPINGLAMHHAFDERGARHAGWERKAGSAPSSRAFNGCC